jgi:thiosulfate/3-mercaptopyruvate sulfurtransferase
VNTAVELDPSDKLRAYTHAERLVTTAWLAEHLDDPNLVVAESDEDVLLYETGHIPGAVKIDWHLDLNDPVQRDYVDAEGFARLMSSKGIARDTTIVFYGDNFNWWAAYALWVTTLFGHQDARLLDGGRQKWVEEGRALTTDVPDRPSASYPVVQRDDTRIRAFREQVLDHVGAGGRLVDVRSPGEYSGELLAMPDYPQEGALRGGHIPGAANVPWKRAANEDGTFKPAEALRGIYEGELGLTHGDDIIAYCRIGERSSHTWFVLSQLLGFPQVRNYDGSWVEWGNSVRVPIERSSEPGPDPRLKAVG